MLLNGLVELGPASRHAQAVMRHFLARKLRPSTAWHCCLEFYAVATRLPDEFRLPPHVARQLVEEGILARFEIHQLDAESHRELIRSAAQAGIVGGRLYDAHIAAIARRAGAKLVVTENIRHFATLTALGIRVANCAELAAELA